jgi:tRNA (cmo5U34)-methyltransferase
VTVLYYTLQFIDTAYRQEVINKIYNSLEWGGALFLFEKVRAADARFQDITTTTYEEYKVRNNFSDEEIMSKKRSLIGILEPFSTQGNLDMLKRAGFIDINSIFKYICFEGFLAIK